MIDNLPDKLKRVTGLTTFAETFGFSWDSDDDWYWSDVAEKMALEVDAYYRRGYEDGLRANTEAAFEAAKQAFERTCRDTGVRHPGWTCSECGSEQMYAPHFCPDCGAKVVEE